MTAPQIKMTLDIFTNGLRETKRMYYKGVPGVTYEDMKAAATRVLEWRGKYEAATGRKVTSKATPKAIATLLRSSL